MDQKAKDNSGSGLSWHLGQGLATPFLRLFRGFQGSACGLVDLGSGKSVLFVQSLLWRFSISLAIGGSNVFFFVSSCIKDFQSLRCVGLCSGEISAAWPVFPAYDYDCFFGHVKLGLIYAGIPHLRYSGEICITLAIWRISVECMPRSSDASSLHLDFSSIITFSLFEISLAFQLWVLRNVYYYWVTD